MPVDATYQAQADREIELRISKLRLLSYREVAELPIEAGEEALLAGAKSSITVFTLRGPYTQSNSLLVAVQVARRGVLGVASYYTERGLIFSPDAPVREATELELQNTGGGNAG
jgi:hypothetical protein